MSLKFIVTEQSDGSFKLCFDNETMRVEVAVRAVDLVTVNAKLAKVLERSLPDPTEGPG